MRKRLQGNDTENIVRPHGPLKDEELEQIGQAYADGCRGEILIGLRGEKRVMTMLLPAQPGQDATESQMIRAAGQLRAIGCDRYLRVRR